MPKTAYIRRFDGGISNDPRFPNSNLSRVVTNFDILTNPYKLTPYRSSEDGDSSASTVRKQAFGIGFWTPSSGSWRLFGLGVVSGSGKAQIQMKTLSTGGTTDLGDAGWATPNGNESSAGTTSFNLFVYYKKTGKFYGAKSSNSFWAFTPDGATAFSEDIITANGGSPPAYTNVAQGCVHPVDDILYIPYDNKIMTNNNATWINVALTLPSDLYITSICPFRNFLAIACAPLSGVGSSRVFLWDRDTSLATVSENIDWGEGSIKVLEELNGDLVGISLSTVRFRQQVTFRRYSGYGAEDIGTLVDATALTSTIILPIAKQKINNRLYFMMQINLNGAVREGVFSIGRSPGRQYSVIQERTPNNNTALSTGFPINFLFVGDYLFQSYVNAGGDYAVSKTDDQANYTANAVFETMINEGMEAGHRPQLKQLMSVGANYEALPTAGQVIMQYRVNGGSWVTVFTETTDSAVYTEPAVRTAAGDEFVQGKDYEFRAVSTGGAEVTGITYKYMLLESNI